MALMFFFSQFAVQVILFYFLFLVGSDMEYNMHIFSISGTKDPNLLCLNVFLLQWHHCELPDLLVWMPKQQH